MLSSSTARAVVPVSWDANIRGQFITSLCRDTAGHVWIGTEDNGVWRYDPSAPLVTQYTHYTTKDGLGDNSAYALACDKAGRVWAGTLNHGVSVFNGKQWKTYGPVDGPLGSHVIALAVSPKDGGVWGATEAGLFRYAHSRWTYFTRADGLPSDQANALAFDADGTLYVGTQCDGIAIASPTDNYQSWRVVPGPKQGPNAASGEGLPSALINCLLVMSTGTVYAGTSAGLAASRDHGLTWQYRRGVDWKDKLAGLSHRVASVSIPLVGDLLREDYVTCLAEDASGQLLIGHRQGGLEVFDPKTGKRMQSGANGGHLDDYVEALLVEDKAVWLGLYGGGLLPPPAPESTAAPKQAAVPPLPVPAAPPTVAQLTAMRTRVLSLKTPLPVGGAAYLGEDWATQGDWVGRYGSRYAVLCAAGAPLDQYVLSDPSYRVRGFAGPHSQDEDGLRSYCAWVHTDDPRVLWDPVAGYRRESEWDDHGEAYPPSFDGPDVWAKVTVPAGLHRLSLYLMNFNGHEDANRWRDYGVEVKAVPGSLDADTLLASGKEADPDILPTAVQARAHNFFGGVYERFAVQGPGVYLVKVGRNGSLNALLQSVLLDKISGPPTAYETRRSIWYGRERYGPPTVPAVSAAPSARLAAAEGLWNALDQSSGQEGAEALLPSFRLLAYRAAAGDKFGDKASASVPTLLANWRWQLSLWTPDQRAGFQQAMNASWQSLLKENPKLAQGNQ